MLLNDKNIISITEANRNFSKISMRAKTSKEPIVIMKNNKPDLVLIDYETYKNLIQFEEEKKDKEIASKIIKEYKDVFDALVK